MIIYFIVKSKSYEKIKILWAVLCISFFYEGYTQSEPEKPVFEAVMFQDGSKIYVQRGLPIYLSVSTTKDGRVLIWKLNKSTRCKSYVFRYRGLITSGVSGPLIRRSRLTMIQKGDSFPIYADGIAPKTKIFFKGSPEYIEGQNTYYGKVLSSF